MDNTFFPVNTCAVRERCALLIKGKAKKENNELKQSGISPEDTLLERKSKTGVTSCGLSVQIYKLRV